MGFWIALAAGSLMLLGAPSSPLPSLLDASLFFGVAWGIRRGKWWAAVAGAYLVLMPLLMLGLNAERPFRHTAVAAALLLTAAYFMLKTASKLRAASPGGAGWPWMAGTGIVLAATLLLRPMMLPTGSMADTLQAGDRFLIETVSFKLHAPAHGELVVFRYPPDRRQTFVKRVVGVPGDRIRIAEKVLYRNGVAVREPYARHTTEFFDRYRDSFPSAPNVVLGAGAETMLARHVQGGEVVVPEGHYFVLGDNRDNSLDSRYWGFVSREDMIGRPLLRYASKSAGGAWPKLLTRS